MEIDIEDINKKYDETINKKFEVPSAEDVQKFSKLIDDLLTYSPANHEDLRQLKGKYGYSGKNSFLYQVYHQLPQLHCQENDMKIRNVLKIKKCKSHSGVLVITVFTSPYPEYTNKLTGEKVKQPFSCKWNCAYCPNEPGQPRSYLKGEPGVLRANKNEFDPIKQMHDRMSTLYLIGHPVDKLEVIVLGGTWTSYPEEYRKEFCRDIYYAANVFRPFPDKDVRDPLSLDEEKYQNRTAQCKVIGLTLETRPDTITASELVNLRMYGCTRVQLGIQHIDDDVLDGIKRRCSTQTMISAVKLLKDSGFKVDGHFMPNLPFTTIEKDRDMLLNKLLGTQFPIPHRRHDYNGVSLWEKWLVKFPEFQIDQWKVYPCEVVPWTDIETWYRNGSYKPYEECLLVDLLLEMKAIMFPWIRLNRIVRDIPTDYIIASSDKPNLRQELSMILQKEGKRCNCIRCREIKLDEWDGSYDLIVREYDASQGKEMFISAESKDQKKLYGFLRLRFPQCQYNSTFPELDGCSLIRELHVYGQLQVISAGSNHVQHRGIGKQLLSVAETISTHGGYKKCAVIAAEGTKNYYHSNGYAHAVGCGGYMVKKL
jgi:histone acetyltransferase (RNA polymerase elongator complex component)